jgi:hypothetical protein
MPERPVFGTLQVQREHAPGQRVSTPPSTPLDASAFGSAPAPKLGAVSERIRFGGEIIAFFGLLMAFAAALIRPSDPTDLAELGGRIYLPAVLKDAFATIQPLPGVSPVGMTESASHIGLANPAVLLLFLVGVGAVFRERWVLTGLVALFLVFPWGLFGFRLDHGGEMLGILAAVAFFRITKPSRRALAVLVPLTFVIGIMVAIPALRFIDEKLSDIFQPTGAEYQTVSFTALMEVDRAEATTANAGTARFLRLSASSPAETAAKAYVVAQELALRGDAKGALAAVDEAGVAGFAPNPFDRKRLNAIRRFAIAAGALGDTAKDAVASRDGLPRTIAALLVAIGTVFALFGPFTSTISNRIARRAVRLDKAQSRIDAQYETMARGGSDTSAPEANAIRSIAALDGRAIAAAIGARARFYRTVLVGLAVASMVFMLGAYWLWLPGPADNTAFDLLSLPRQLAGMLGEAGLAKPDERHDLVSAVTSQLVLVFPFVAVFLMRKRRPVALVGLVLLAFSVIHIARLAPIRHSFVEVAPTVIRAEMIATWQKSVDNPDDDKTPRVVPGTEAAYALAQLAYFSGRAADTQAYLGKVRNVEALGGGVHVQKIDLMREWTAAVGFPVVAGSAVAEVPARMFVTRWISTASLGLGIACAALALVALVAGFFADRRRRRIEDLVTARAADISAGRWRTISGKTEQRAATSAGPVRR